ncbi:MAG: homoserine O-acetyltransferase [Propionibacteriaceae bacterium]|nr:homoserine O-acetyltransferase [Propionibacteriaceae bacterium]
MASDPLNTVTADVQLFTKDHPLSFAKGGQLTEVTVRYETYGTLNENKTNAVFVCHALTGDAHAAGQRDGEKKPGWWDSLIGPGKPIDTDRFYVICPNLLGGCQGTTGPSSINPATGKSYGLGFPALDMRDFVSVHRGLVSHLGIDTLLATIGGSLGGMQVLQWALDAPQDMASAIIIAASSRLTAQNIAFSAVAREAIMRDDGFSGGQYVDEGTSPDTGLSIARMMAHITYTSEGALWDKFGRSPQNTDLSGDLGVDFAVESYLQYQGETFLDRFDALSYLYLSRVMDYFDPFAHDGACELLSDHPVPTLVCSFSSDWRFSSRQSKRIATRLERAGVPVTYQEIEAGVGHDSFLLEIPDYLELVGNFLDYRLEVAHDSSR